MKQPADARAERDLELETRMASYLLDHPDFFVERESLLTDLRLPHPVSGRTVSLYERQVSLLREQKLDLKHKLNQLAQVARGNEHLLGRIEGLLLDLLECQDLATVVTTIETALRNDFEADAATVWIISPGFLDPDDAILGPFQQTLAKGHPICGHLRPEQMLALFGADAAPTINSGAVIPLCEIEGQTCVGLIAIGSVDPRRYHPEMGTVFLRHLGALATRLIRRLA